jgi:outer membrane protein OmpA-like peptidoglycan-associated protein
MKNFMEDNGVIIYINLQDIKLNQLIGKNMKKMKFTALLLCGALLLGSCSTMNNTTKGGVIGGGSGAAAGAIIGGLIGKGKGAAIGAAVGAAVGTGAGVAIGHKMDKKAAEAAKIEGAQVEQVTDNNGLPAVKVSFAAGILFAFNSSALSNEAKSSLRELAQILKEDPTTDIAIIGHTDKVGTYEANMKVSKNRAYSVENYLQDCGVSPAQFKKVEGVGYTEYDDNLSADQNRRVEIYMYASEQMIKNAEAGK